MAKRKSKAQAQDNKSVFAAVLLSAAALLLLCFAVYISEGIRYYNLSLRYKKIEKAQYAVYEDYPFSSQKEASYEITNNETLLLLDKTINDGYITLFRPIKYTCAVRIDFDDGSSMIAFVSGSKIGLDYGRVWIDSENIKQIFTVEE